MSENVKINCGVVKSRFASEIVDVVSEIVNVASVNVGNLSEICQKMSENVGECCCQLLGGALYSIY